MIKTIMFGDKPVEFCTSFAWTFIYKSQFKRDPAKLLMPAIVMARNEAEEGGELDLKEEKAAFLFYAEIGFTGLAEIAWAMAKLADNDVPEPMAWIASYGDDFNAADLLEELLPEIIDSCLTSKKA